MRSRKPIRGASLGAELLTLDEALAALGHDGVMGTRLDEVPLADIVGTVDRVTDFDREFRLLNPALDERWRRLDCAITEGFDPPPVQLVQLGELYFVEDGHHRVSVARARGRLDITARVRRICTIAYAMACLRLAHLPAKAAERRFLARVPLSEDVRRELWLDEPADWARLGDAAEAWAWRHGLCVGSAEDLVRFAAEWWDSEVIPVLARLRSAGVGLDLRDIELYASALAVRDRRGSATWPLPARGPGLGMVAATPAH